MNKKILLTGLPGVGKTTIIRKVINNIFLNSGMIGGFFTKEIRENNRRVGFQVKTILSCEIDIIAHEQHKSSYKMHNFGINLNAFEKTLLMELKNCVKRNVSLIVIDEIGIMETKSFKYCQKLLEILNGHKPILGVLKKKENPFLNKIRQVSDLNIIEVNRANRNDVSRKITQWFEIFNTSQIAYRSLKEINSKGRG